MILIGLWDFLDPNSLYIMNSIKDYKAFVPRSLILTTLYITSLIKIGSDKIYSPIVDHIANGANRTSWTTGLNIKFC